MIIVKEKNAIIALSITINYKKVIMKTTLIVNNYEIIRTT